MSNGDMPDFMKEFFDGFSSPPPDADSQERDRRRDFIAGADKGFRVCQSHIANMLILEHQFELAKKVKKMTLHPKRN